MGNSIPKATASLNEITGDDISNSNNKTIFPMSLEEGVLLYKAKISNLVGAKALNVIGKPQLHYLLSENTHFLMTITG